MNESIKHRMDNRSVEVGRHNIMDFTERESCWGEAYRLHLIEDGWECSIIEWGVDNSGELIEGKLNNFNVDKKFILDKDGQHIEMLVEIKTAPENLKSFFTFKVSSLKQCVKQFANILLPRLQEFYIFDPSKISKMLCFDHKIYPGFSPNDLAVRIPMVEINKLSQPFYWNTNAKKFINSNKELLTREKKR